MATSEFNLLCEWPSLKNFFDSAWRLFKVNLALVSPDGAQSVCYDRNTRQSPFCMALQREDAGQQMCSDCDQRFFKQAIIQLTPLKYRCHAGLTEFVVPIVRQGRVIGLLQCGQIFGAKPSNDEWRGASQVEIDHGLDAEHLKPLFFHARILPAERQSDLLLFLEMMASHLANSDSVLLAGPVGDNQGHAIMRRIIAYVESHLDEPMPSATIAKAVHVSNRTLARMFRREMKSTLLQFVIERRVARACHHLVSSDKSCTEIAFAVGFQSVQNFNRVFKKSKNATPREWRLRIAQQEFGMRHESKSVAPVKLESPRLNRLVS